MHVSGTTNVVTDASIAVFDLCGERCEMSGQLSASIMQHDGIQYDTHLTKSHCNAPQHLTP